MLTRKRCTNKGHRWVGYVNGWRLPVQYCLRFGCKAERWDPWSIFKPTTARFP